MTWPQYRRGWCSHNGRSVRLTRLEAEIVSTLLMRQPAPITARELVELVYDHPDREPDWPINCMRVLMNRIRKKIPGAIESRHGMGYCIQRQGTEDQKESNL